MATLKELQTRLKKIERETGSHLVTFTLADGSTKKLLNCHVLQAMYDGFVEGGIRSRECEIILASVSNNADHKLVELFKMCAD